MLTVTYAECHINAPYAECCYAECRGAYFLGVLNFLFGLYTPFMIVLPFYYFFYQFCFLSSS
jgi:hypothetical protein